MGQDKCYNGTLKGNLQVSGSLAEAQFERAGEGGAVLSRHGVCKAWYPVAPWVARSGPGGNAVPHVRGVLPSRFRHWCCVRWDSELSSASTRRPCVCECSRGYRCDPLWCSRVADAIDLVKVVHVCV